MQLTSFDGTKQYGKPFSSQIIGMWHVTSIGRVSPAKITMLTQPVQHSYQWDTTFTGIVWYSRV